ncbi:MAG: copper homeostasis protein CutC [Terriglobia bacterium]
MTQATTGSSGTARPIDLEIIVCSLDDALAAYRGGATRLEVCVGLDHAGLTPPPKLVEQILARVPLRVRIMVRESAAFAISGGAELDALKRRARAFAALGVDGLVTGHTKDGKLDLEALQEIIGAAPSMRFTIHHAIEETTDPLATLRALRGFPNVDCALVKGGTGTLAERVERLAAYQQALGDKATLVVGGNVTLEMLPTLRGTTFLRAFHLGRAARTPEATSGAVDWQKVRKAMKLLLGN